MQGIPLYEMSVEDFIRPINIGMRSQLITASAAAKHMIEKRSGCDIIAYSNTRWKSVCYDRRASALCATALKHFQETLRQNSGPKVFALFVCVLQAHRIRKSLKDLLRTKEHWPKKKINEIENDAMLKRLPLMKEVASVAVFLVSDMASGMTGTTANITCGTAMD